MMEETKQYVQEAHGKLQQALNKLVEKSTYVEARSMKDNQSPRETKRLFSQIGKGKKEQMDDNKWQQDLDDIAAEIIHKTVKILDEDEYKLYKKALLLDHLQFNKKGEGLYQGQEPEVWYMRGATAHKNGEEAKAKEIAFGEYKKAEKKREELDEEWKKEIEKFYEAVTIYDEKMKNKRPEQARFRKEVKIMRDTLVRHFGEENLRAEAAGHESAFGKAHPKTEEEPHRKKLRMSRVSFRD